MRLELINYLQNIKENLRLNTAEEKEVLRELATHIEERCQEMQDDGLTEDESTEKCLDLLGSARVVARQIYETHNQGSWRQALLAGMPHLFFAGLFALNWLGGVTWLPVIVLIVAGIVIYGRCHGKPAWLFPWFGYSLLPVAAAGVALLYLPAGWAWVTLILYIPLMFWLACVIAIKFMRRDWLYSALMLLPVPTFVGCFLATGQKPAFNFASLDGFAPWMAFVFLILAFSVTIFVRLRSRKLRIAVLGVSGFMTLIIIFAASNQLGVLSFCGLILLMLGSIFVPVYMEKRTKPKDQVVLS